MKDASAGSDPAGVEAHTGVSFDVKVSPVFGEENCFPCAGLVRPGGNHAVPPRFVVFGMKHVEKGKSGNLSFGVLQGDAPGAVDVEEAAIWPHALNQVGGIFEQIAVLFLTSAQGILGMPAAGALVRLLQRATYGRDQTGQPVLEHVIRRARFEAFDSDFIANSAGYEEERHVGTFPPRNGKGFWSLEVWNAIIRKDQIEAAVLQGCGEPRRVADLDQFALRPL